MDQFENSDSYEELGRLFIADWKQNVKYQSVADFKARMFVFMKLISRLIFKEYRVDLANSLSRDMALFLLSDSDENNQLKGIKFMAQFYHGLVNWLCDYEDPWVIDLNEDKIKEKKEIAKKFNEPVALFAKRNRQFEKTVNQLQATRLVDKKEILDLFLDVIKIYSYEGGYKDEVESFDRDADMLLIDSVNLWELWDFTVNHGFTFYASEYEERLFAEKLYYNRIGECFLASAIGSIWHNQLKNTMEKISEFIDQIDGMGGQSFLWARVVSVHCFLYLHSKVNNYYDKNRINKIKEVLQSDTLRKHVKSIWEKYTIKENDGNGKIVEDEKIIQDTIEMVVFDLMSYQISDDIEDHFAIPFSKKVIGYFSYLYSAILGRDFNKTTISFDKFEKHDSSLGVWP